MFRTFAGRICPEDSHWNKLPGWLNIRLQCFINVCFNFFTTGWYVVAKGNIRSWPFCFCVSSGDCPEAKLFPDRDLSIICFLGTLGLLLWGVVWIPKCSFQFFFFFFRVNSNQSCCSTFNWRNHILARDEVRELENKGEGQSGTCSPYGFCGRVVLSHLIAFYCKIGTLNSKR